MKLIRFDGGDQCTDPKNKKHGRINKENFFKIYTEKIYMLHIENSYTSCNCGGQKTQIDMFK